MAPPSTQLLPQRRRSAPQQHQQQQAALRAGILVRKGKPSSTSSTSTSSGVPHQSQQQPAHATKPRSSYFPESSDGVEEEEYESEPSSIWERPPGGPGAGLGAPGRLLPPPLPPGARLLAPLALEQDEQELEVREQKDRPPPIVDAPATTASRWERQECPASPPVALADSGALSPLLFLHPRALRRLHARLVEQQQQQQRQPEALAVAASVYPTEPCLRRLPPHALPARGLGAAGQAPQPSAFSLVLQEAVEAVDGGMERLLDHCFVQAPGAEESERLPVVLEDGGEASEAGYRSLLQWTLHSLSTAPPAAATASSSSPLPLALAPIRLLVAPRGPDTLSVRAEQLVPGLALRLAPVAPLPYRSMEETGARMRGGFLALDAQGGGVVVVGGVGDERPHVGVWVPEEAGEEGQEELTTERLMRSPVLWAAALRFVVREQQQQQQQQKQRSFLVAALRPALSPSNAHQPPRFFEAEWSWAENQHQGHEHSDNTPSFALLDFRADVSWDPEEEEAQGAPRLDEWEEAIVGRFRPAACPAVVEAFQRAAASTAASSAPSQQQQQQQEEESREAPQHAASFASSYLSHIALPADSPPSLPPSPMVRPFHSSFGASAASLLGGEAVSALTLEESRMSSTHHLHAHHHLSSSHPLPPPPTRAPVLPPPPQRAPPAAQQEEEEEEEGFRTERERQQQEQIEALQRRVQELEVRLSEAQAALALASSLERERGQEEGGGRTPMEWVVVDGAQEEEEEEEAQQQQQQVEEAAAVAAAAASSDETREGEEEASTAEEEAPAPAAVEPVADVPPAESCLAPAALVFKQLDVPKILFPCGEEGEEDDGPIETPSVLEIEKKYLRMLGQEQQQGGGAGEDDG